jgi:hypothetical protein
VRCTSSTAAHRAAARMHRKFSRDTSREG